MPKPESVKVASAVKQPSAAVRTLKAKLQVLKRPTVWGSLLVLLLPLVFLANYWNNLSRSELAVGATAADLPAPPAEPEANFLPPLQPDFLNGLLPGSGPTPAPDARSQQSAASKPSQPAKSSAAPVVPAVPPIGFSPTNAANRAVDPATGLAADSAQAPAQAPASPLQAALDRRTGINSTAQTGPNGSSSGLRTNPAQTTAQTGIAAQPAQSAVTSIYEFGSTNGLPGIGSVPAPSGFGQPFVPQTSPAAGTTGYTLPPALRTPTVTAPQILPAAPTQLPTQLPTGPNRAFGQGAAVPTPTVIAPAPQVPFSVPRVPPGRFIGNGEISTFSNP